MSAALACLACGKDLLNIFDDTKIRNQPSAGTTFRSHGQYGSTVFDPGPMSSVISNYLEINICDECMKVRAAQGLIWHMRTMQGPDITLSSQLWKPDTEEC